MDRVIKISNGSRDTLTVCDLRLAPGQVAYVKCAYAPPAEWRAGAKVQYDPAYRRHELICTNGLRIPIIEAMAAS